MEINKIKVLVVDDQTELANEISAVLSTDESLQVVGTAADGFDALNKMPTLKPDVVLLDIRMPNMNGVVTTSHIKREYPDVKVLILTTFDDSDYILSAINNGASGYLLKDIGGGALINAIKSAYEGDTILPSNIARRITDAAKHVAADREIKLMRAFMLSEREIEVALMMYDGFTNRQISSALKLSEGTTRNYVSSIYVKTGCENRMAAIEAIKSALQ
ncbi:MAG: response regulator transcription factor [Clostridia bacterium]|nr:response regulator transcription factor [Clostridia bacterium]